MLETLDSTAYLEFMETRVSEVKTVDIVRTVCPDLRATVVKTAVVDTLDFKETEDCLAKEVTRV